MLELKYSLTSDDFIAFNVHFSLTSEAAQRPFRAFRWRISLIPAILFGAGIGIIFGDLLIGILTAIGGFAVLWFCCPQLWSRAVRKNIRLMAKDNGLGEPGARGLFADERGLRQTSANGESFKAWSGILRIEETDEHAFIYIGPTQAFVIPKRNGESEVSALLAKVRQHCPNLSQEAP